MPPTDPFTIEAWTYLAIDLVVVFGRFFGRWWYRGGLRGLAPDDYLMVVAGLLYTAETATAHYVGAYWFGLANSGMTPEQRAALDPASQEYYLRTEGSKTQLFGWLVYTVLLWTLKTCWLFFYKRLGDGVDHMNLKIYIGFAFVGITFLGTFFTILCGCWPISKHWQINPDPGNFCQPAVSRLQAWTLITTNLLTDFYIISIPLPMVWSARISSASKCGLIAMFSGGLITAIFGGLRCGYVLQNSANGPQLAGEWSCRESFVAVFISNIPILFPMFRRGFSSLRSASGRSGYGHASSGGSSSKNKGRKAGGSGGGAFNLSSLSNKREKDSKKKFQHPLSLPGETFYERYGSEEEIITDDSDRRSDPKGQNSTQVEPVADDITVTREWRVQSRVAPQSEREQELRRAVHGYHAR